MNKPGVKPLRIPLMGLKEPALWLVGLWWQRLLSVCVLGGGGVGSDAEGLGLSVPSTVFIVFGCAVPDSIGSIPGEQCFKGE